AAFERKRHVAEQDAIADRQRQPVRLDDGAAAASGLQELEAERAVAPGQQRDLRRALRAFLLEPADVRELRLRLLRLALLRAEAFDEALEPRDVDLHAPHLLLRVHEARRLLAPPRVPRSGEEGAAPGDDLERRGRHGFEEPAV